MAETDRELLELAAKAVGIKGEYHALGIYFPFDDYWNPLNNDGQALRLAVKLRLNVHIEDYGTAARKHDYMPWNCCETHLHGGIEAATRRAITRAAAELARAQGEKQ